MDLLRGTKRARHFPAGALDFAVDRARDKFGALLADGNYLPNFLILDAAFLVLITAFMLASYYFGDGYEYDVQFGNNALLWTTLYFIKVWWALSTFPFSVFWFPVIGPAVHGAAYTGYDMAGLLCPLLTDTQIKEKQKLEQEQDEREARGYTSQTWSESMSQAYKMSKMRRWGRATIGAALPPLRLII